MRGEDITFLIGPEAIFHAFQPAFRKGSYKRGCPMVQISLIIPAYNAGPFLDATLRSVCQQDMADFECLLVDDFSDDDTLAIANRWRARDQRIRVIQQRGRSGVSAARNAGLRAANGVFCAFLDADDLLMKNSLSVRLAAWHKAARAAGPARAGRIAGSYCGSQAIDETRQKAPLPRPAGLPPLGFATIGARCPFNANQPMIRRDILREMGGFNETMSQAEDYDLWTRILRAGYWFVPAAQVAVTYRVRQGSAVRKSPLRHLERALKLQDSGAQPLDQTSLTRSPGRMMRPQHDYALQASKAARVLQFTGMDLAVPAHRPVADLAQMIRTHLPDLDAVLAPDQDPRRLIAEGISRQTTQPLTQAQEHLVSELCDALDAGRDGPGEDAAKATAESFGPFGEAGPDRLWHPSRQAAPQILFFPHKAYHTWTIGLAAPAMRAAGLRFGVVDLTPQWREAGVRDKAQEMDLPLIPMGELALGDYHPTLVVVFNDWDYVTRPIIMAARQAGVPTMAIVEGIQDYHDVDTGRQRHAYRSAETVLLPGDFDRRYFAEGGGQDLAVVGIPRIQHLRAQARQNAPAPPSRRILINSNFSHNVLTEHRDAWLADAVHAVQAAGYQPVISRHPEDLGTGFPELVTQDSFYDALTGCAGSVQRFASGMLESLAMGVPVIYYNPHGERVDKFSDDPMGAYPVVTNRADLTQKLASLPEWAGAARRASEAFLDRHCGAMDIESGAEITRALQQATARPVAAQAVRDFQRNLRLIDRETGALTQRRMLFEDPSAAMAQMEELLRLDQADPARQARTLLETVLPEDGQAPPDRPAHRSVKALWRLRVMLHHGLERAYHASARWPRFHRWARALGERYMRRFSPF